ncbi:hypothetical protein HZH68_012608 [Vespula germanica]|uniref:Uncharacterized protein n=1 Tax=Vespula germanica TaxID=30212 RepID=A0A834JNM8_VESGE|nr:hypothetical protein HZH68_012608 [Vespula germanica]
MYPMAWCLVDKLIWADLIGVYFLLNQSSYASPEVDVFEGSKEEFVGCEMMRWKSGRTVEESGRGRWMAKGDEGWERQVESAVWCFPPNLPANSEQPLRACYPAMLWYNGESPELSRRHFRRDRALTPSNKPGSEQQ